jgi:crotonobetainyl-CoA:carnitine CoA-transferase CaiB-like acyl-CoA transferase
VWRERLLAHEVPSSPVYASDEVLRSAQVRHLELEVADEAGPMGPFRTIRNPVSFDGERPLDVVAPPVLGQHNDELLGPKRADEAAE